MSHKSMLDRALSASFIILLVALILNVSWCLLKPVMVPMLGIGIGTAAASVVMAIVRRRRSTW